MKKIYFFSFTAILLFSCQKNETLKTSNLENYGNIKTQTFVYNNKIYELNYRQISGTTVKYLCESDDPALVLLDKLYANPKLAILTFANDPDITYMFDNEELKNEYLSYLKDPNVKKTTWRPLYLWLFQHKTFGGQRFDATDPDDGATPAPMYGGYYGFGDLSHYSVDFNDKTSSLQVLNYTENQLELILYEHVGYAGCSWTILFRPYSVNGTGDSNQDWEKHNLCEYYDIYWLRNFQNKHMKTTGSWPFYTKHSWNDNVSSIKWKERECIENCLCN